MDYQNIYNQIIERAKSADRKKVKGGTYFENHHTIPRCLGGSNSNENKVLLTAKEHFICHKLLIIIYPLKNKKLINALWILSTMKDSFGRNYRVGAREYENLRKCFAKQVSEFMTGRFVGELNPMHSHIGELNHNFGIKGSLNTSFGKRRSEETKNKIRNSSIGRKMTEEQKQKLRVPKSEEFRINKSLAMKGTNLGKHNPNFDHRWSEDKKNDFKEFSLNRPKVKCPYCDKAGPYNIMKRWHFENCKLKNN